MLLRLHLICNGNLKNVMGKTICDWSKKDIRNNPEKLHAITREACFFCRKCGRVANTKKALCSSESFSSCSKVKKGKLAVA